MMIDMMVNVDCQYDKTLSHPEDKTLWENACERVTFISYGEEIHLKYGWHYSMSQGPGLTNKKEEAS